MKFSKILFSAACLLGLQVAQANSTDITGAGATFPYPIYAKWAQAYQAQNKVNVNYQAIGSGGGIQQIIANTVDFGASDKPLSDAELAKNGLMQFPTVIGGVVPVVNIPGVIQLKLSASVLANIYLGKIKNWHDASIAALNPAAKLPDQLITVVHRSDGSGTTFLFTDYLAKVSADWKNKIGADTAVAWPCGIGGKGNEGVAAYVQRIPGAIGYVEFAYAKQNKLSYVTLQNQDQQFVKPSLASFKAAASNAHWQNAKDFTTILTNQAGKDSWPITGASFILMHTQPKDANKSKQVLAFFTWAYQHGANMATELDYAPLPDDVVKVIEQNWQKAIHD